METENHKIIIEFLSLKTSGHKDKTHKPTMYMVLKNALMCDYYGGSKNLIEYHFHLIETMPTEYSDGNLGNMMYYFEEKNLHGSMNTGKFFVNIFEKILTEEADEFDGENEQKLMTKHFMLGLMMIHWNYSVLYFARYKSLFLYNLNEPNSEPLTTLENVPRIPFFEIISSILKKDDLTDTFFEMNREMVESFREIYKMPNIYRRKYQQETSIVFDMHEVYSTSMSFIFLYAAIKTNQEIIARLVFECFNFNNSVPEFPKNMKVEKIHQQVALLFLENRYELGRNVLPEEWITTDNFKQFLDSRISKQNGYFKIDCRFMLPFYNYGETVTNKEDLDDEYYMNEDYITMDYIVKDHDLKSLMSHPVMEIITKVKFKKYHRVLMWNAIMFLAFYLVPLMILLYKINFIEYDVTWSSVTLILLFIGLGYIIVRETFQFVFVCKGKFRKYFKDESNLVETALILSTIFLMIVSVIEEGDSYLLMSLEIINIILVIFVTSVSLPILKFAIFMKIVGKVFITYLNIFIIFLPFTLGSFALLSIIFSKKFDGGIEDFHSIQTGMMKYMIMFSGEIEIEPDKVLTFLQGVGLTLIIILLVNHSNLLLSMTVNDVKEEMEKSKIESLHINAKKYVTFARAIREFYAKNIE